MKQSLFEKRHKAFWTRFAELVEHLEKGEKSSKDSDSQIDFSGFPQNYRQLCRHLSLARHRGYSADRVHYLNALMLRAHQILYRRESQFWMPLLGFLRVGFPNSIRQNLGYVTLAAALFIIPTLLATVAVIIKPNFIYAVLDAHTVADFEGMYNPASERLGRSRASETDIMMFGHYIQNNISVAFRTFATGFVFTLGSLFFLIFNGVYFGVVAGHLTNIGYTEPFFTFVIAHSSFELTAIVFSGAAGIRLGHALLAPGMHSRLHALKLSARECIPILYGIIAMLLIAAFIEAFWSSIHTLPAWIKYSVGATLWLTVISYFVFVGNRRINRKTT